MTIEPAWIAATAAMIAAIFAGLSFRQLRRQNRAVKWEVDRGTSSRRDWGGGEVRIINRGAVTARDVTVTFSDAQVVPQPVAVTDDVAPGGALIYTPQVNAMCEFPNTTVSVSWRQGLLRRRRTWNMAY